MTCHLGARCVIDQLAFFGQLVSNHQFFVGSRSFPNTIGAHENKFNAVLIRIVVLKLDQINVSVVGYSRFTWQLVFEVPVTYASANTETSFSFERVVLLEPDDPVHVLDL